MSATFRRVGRLAKGYDVQEVDGFLSRETADVTPDAVRLVAFTVRRHGYDVHQVDQALDQIEDDAAARARERLVVARGERARLDQLEDQARSLQGRLARRPGRRFRRGRRVQHTYAPAEVDALCDALAAYLADGRPMSVDDVRGAVFRGRRGRWGYREADVDAFLDRAAAVMLAVD